MMSSQVILSLCISCFALISLASENNQISDSKNKRIQTAETIKPELKSCKKTKDCTAALVGCWSWVAVNKKFTLRQIGNLSAASREG